MQNYAVFEKNFRTTIKENELGRIPQNGEGGHGIILRDSIDSLKLKR